MAEAELVIETRGLTKVFNRFAAVEDLDLRVPRGALYGFLGPNGAGKSTTIRMLLGLMGPTSGTIHLFNRELAKHRLEILRRVGSLVEAPSYYEHLTAFENLEITRRILQLPKGEIDKALEIVKLAKWKNQRVREFSLGMKQRLGIAQALLGKRELLILDEPTNGLDPAGVREIRELIVSLPERMNATVLISSHILSEIELIADHVGIIHQGKLLFQGTLAELKARGREEIIIKANPLRQAAEFLKGKGYAVAIKGDKLCLPGKNTDLEAVNRELVLKGFRVSHLSERPGNLEDIFLQLTGEVA